MVRTAPSNKQPIVIDVDPPAISDLTFQDFPTSGVLPLPYNPDIKDTSSVIDNNEAGEKYSIWSWEYFQKFFDVNTEDVVNRIKGSLWPKTEKNYLEHHIRPKPDLYGPFWICVTLVFAIGISGNMANYLQAAAHHKYHWKYNFHAVTGAATAVFLYSWVLPVVWWGVLKVEGNKEFTLTLLELICVYGYSLAIYIPISILWVIQISSIQWLLVSVGTAISGYVLVSSLRPAFGPKQYVFILAIIFFKILLAVGFMLYFFHVPSYD